MGRTANGMAYIGSILTRVNKLDIVVAVHQSTSSPSLVLAFAATLSFQPGLLTLL